MSESVHASAKSSVAITPSDTAQAQFSALYIGGGGNVAIKHTLDATAVTYTGLVAGSILPVESGHGGGRVMATNTTATSIVAMVW